MGLWYMYRYYIPIGDDVSGLLWDVSHTFYRKENDMSNIFLQSTAG